MGLVGAVVDWAEAVWDGWADGFPVDIAVLAAVLYMSWVYLQQQQATQKEVHNDVRRRSSTLSSPLPPRVSPMPPRLNPQPSDRPNRWTKQPDHPEYPRGRPQHHPMPVTTEAVEVEQDGSESGGGPSPFAGAPGPDEDAAARKIQHAWRKRFGGGLASRTHPADGGRSPSSRQPRGSAKDGKEGHGGGATAGGPTAGGEREAKATPMRRTPHRRGNTHGSETRSRLGLPTASGPTSSADSLGRRGVSEWDMFHAGAHTESPVGPDSSILGPGGSDRELGPSRTQSATLHGDRDRGLGPGQLDRPSTAPVAYPMRRVRTPASPDSVAEAEVSAEETAAEAGWVLGTAAAVVYALGLAAARLAPTPLAGATSAAFWLGDVGVVTDAGVTLAVLVGSSSRLATQPHWTLGLQLLAACATVAAWTHPSLVAALGWQRLPPRLLGAVKLARGFVLPSVSARWVELDAVACWAAVGVYCVAVGTVLLCTLTPPLTSRDSAIQSTVGAVLVATGTLGLLQIRAGFDAEGVRRRSSVAPGELSAHHHTLSARRACIIRAFGPEIDADIALASTIARKFRYEFLPAGSVLHMERDTRVAVLIEGKVLGISGGGTAEISAPPNRYLGAIVTPPGHTVYDTYKALTPSKMYVLELEQIEDVQRECEVLREVIKEKRQAQIVGRNVKHVIATVRQAMWYSAVIGCLLLGGVVLAGRLLIESNPQ